MVKVVKVTPAQVNAARLKLKRSVASGRPVTAGASSEVPFARGRHLRAGAGLGQPMTTAAEVPTWTQRGTPCTSGTSSSSQNT
jgi:hypothetical protein